MTRLLPTLDDFRLLAEVNAGHVIFGIGPNGMPGTGLRPTPTAWLVDRGMARRDVHRWIAEQEQASLIERPDRTAEWRLTAAGRAILTPTRYVVEFEHITASGHPVAVPALTTPVITDAELVDRVDRYVRVFFNEPRAVEVGADLVFGVGTIFEGFLIAGTYSITAVTR